MIKRLNFKHLVKGFGLSSALFLLAACQDVNAEMLVDGFSETVQSSAVVEAEPITQKSVPLRDEIVRTADPLNFPELSEEVEETIEIVSEDKEPVVPTTEPTTPVEEEIAEETVPETIEETPAVDVIDEVAVPVEEEKEPVFEKKEPVYTYDTTTETTIIPFETLYVLNDEMDNDQFNVLQDGKDGEMIDTWLHAYKDGVWESKHVTKTAVYDPQPKIIMVGTNIVYVPKDSTLEEEKARIEALPLVPGAY